VKTGKSRQLFIFLSGGVSVPDFMILFLLPFLFYYRPTPKDKTVIDENGPAENIC